MLWEESMDKKRRGAGGRCWGGVGEEAIYKDGDTNDVARCLMTVSLFLAYRW